MAAGIPATPLLCARKTRSFGLVVCKLDAVAGVEIIPLEPDQRSDLRREAPSVTLILPSLLPFSGWGQIQNYLRFLSPFFYFMFLATIRLQTGAV